jgi:hypothetical protein
MSDNDIREALKGAYQAAERKPPPFDAVWAGAEKRRRTRQRRLYGGVAAAVAAVAVVAGLWTGQPAQDEFMIAEALLNDTSWVAPSDALMPEHQFDIYRDIPVPGESTISPEGSLL